VELLTSYGVELISLLRRLENMIRIGQTSVGGRKKITGVFKTPMLGASGVQNLTSNIRDLDDAFQDFLVCLAFKHISIC
jgi:hypothetical protein